MSNLPLPSPRDGLHIALLARAAPGELHDPLIYVAELAAALQRAGLHLHILADQPPAVDVPFYQVEFTPAEPGDAVADARRFCASAVQGLARLSELRGPFHILHACSWNTAPAALSARRHGGARAAVTFLDTLFMRTGQCGGDRITTHMRNLEQQAVREADLLIAGHEEVRRQLAWLYSAPEERVHVVPADALPTAVAIRPARPDPASAPCLGFVGPWTHDGGSDVFLQMVRELAPLYPGLRFVLAAEGASPSKVEADVRRRGLGHLLLSPEGTGDPLAVCHVAVSPARAAVGHRGLYRARALGIPVVVARTGAAELVDPGRTGSVTYPTAAALGVEVKAWLSLPALVPAESFTWDLAAANLIAQYRVVLARSNAAPELIDHVARSR
jgi:glycosyltransferase involved in cell wall biosynthesis